MGVGEVMKKMIPICIPLPPKNKIEYQNIYDEAIECLNTPIVHETIYGTYKAYMLSEEEADCVRKALERAKKVEELLELYKSVHGVVQSWDTMPDVQNKINKLEKELEELKWE